jgi:hypothetical protein
MGMLDESAAGSSAIADFFRSRGLGFSPYRFTNAVLLSGCVSTLAMPVNICEQKYTGQAAFSKTTNGKREPQLMTRIQEANVKTQI